MDDKTIELRNTGIIKPEYVKNVTHFFCRVVMAKNCEGNLGKAIEAVKHNIINYSKAWTEKTGIRAITWKDKLLEIFFNQEKRIPGYVYYWLNCYYNFLLKEFDGDSANYSGRHYNIYDKLQRMYIEHYRWRKQDAKEDKKIERQQRRRLCKLYRSGEYAETFQLYGKNFSELMKQDELEKVALMMDMLFANNLDDVSGDEYEQYAAAYLLGRIQGRGEAAI